MPRYRHLQTSIKALLLFVPISAIVAASAARSRSGTTTATRCWPRWCNPVSALREPRKPVARPNKTRWNLCHANEGNPDARARRPVGGGRSRVTTEAFSCAKDLPMMRKWISAAMVCAAACSAAHAQERVTFPSQDGKTTLTGYLFLPQQRAPARRRPAIVMMHGRAGAYSSLANGSYNADTLSKRHKAWGELWAQQGYVALMVDGFGPRGYPAGFERHSYDSRPADLNEVTIRPLDAYGALTFLRTRADVDGSRIGLQGWSNGGSAALAAMAAGSGFVPGSQQGFAAALAFYPACGLKDAFKESGYIPYAPLLVLMGAADEEVSPKRCEKLVTDSRKQGGDIEIRLYDGAEHGFDDPGTKRQRVDANADATDDALKRALRFFKARLSVQR
jgi:dienelactone hydrolase